MRPSARICLLILTACVCSAWVAGCSVSDQAGSTPPAGAKSANVPVAKSANVSVAKSATVSDPTGDVRDGNKQKPTQKLPGADLTAASIEAVGPDFKITFTSDSDFQSTIQPAVSAVWMVSACNQDGSGCCLIGARVAGGEWVAYVFDETTSRNTYIGKPAINATQLTFTVKQGELPPSLRVPFNWSAESDWDGKWEDRAPDAGDDFLHAPTVPFPQS